MQAYSATLGIHRNKKQQQIGRLNINLGVRRTFPGSSLPSTTILTNQNRSNQPSSKKRGCLTYFNQPERVTLDLLLPPSPPRD